MIKLGYEFGGFEAILGHYGDEESIGISARDSIGMKYELVLINCCVKLDIGDWNLFVFICEEIFSCVFFGGDSVIFFCSC